MFTEVINQVRSGSLSHRLLQKPTSFCNRTCRPPAGIQIECRFKALLHLQHFAEPDALSININSLWFLMQKEFRNQNLTFHYNINQELIP